MVGMENTGFIDFKRTIDRMRDTGFSPAPSTVGISVPDARNVLWQGIRHFIGESAVWLPEYERIAEWMTDNRGRGLLCFGNCGRGKTLVCGRVLPLVLNHYCRKVVSCYDAQQLNARTDEVKSRHIVYVDDIGTEAVSVKYGERRMAFPELADEAEKKGKLLLLTTNLSLDDLKDKYGERTVDRLRAITKTVLFSGESLRR